MLFGVVLVVLMSVALPASGEDKRLELVNLLAGASDEAVEAMRWPIFSEDGEGRMYAWDDGSFTMENEAGRIRIYFGYRNCLKHVYEAWDATYGFDTPYLPHGKMEGVCHRKFAFTAEAGRELALEHVTGNWPEPSASPVKHNWRQDNRRLRPQIRHIGKKSCGTPSSRVSYQSKSRTAGGGGSSTRLTANYAPGSG